MTAYISPTALTLSTLHRFSIYFPSPLSAPTGNGKARASTTLAIFRLTQAFVLKLRFSYKHAASASESQGIRAMPIGTPEQTGTHSLAQRACVLLNQTQLWARIAHHQKAQLSAATDSASRNLIQQENARPDTRDWMLTKTYITDTDPDELWRSPPIEGYCSETEYLLRCRPLQSNEKGSPRSQA